jgi:predicted enzyme related to lactoylglutathione lyase
MALDWLPGRLPHPVVRGLLVSADRDIVISDIPGLVKKYAAVAADWESGAIAWVAQKNGLGCLILRGVTDLVGATGGEAYGNLEIFHENTKSVMKTLIEQLPDWLNGIRSESVSPSPLLDKVDCIRLYVPDLESGLEFYRDQLGQPLMWRSAGEAGLRMPGSESEIVLQIGQAGQEVDITVGSADAAAQRFAEAGGELVVAPFDIPIGRGCVVRDPWGNQLVLLDTSKGLLATDNKGNVNGNL